MPYDGPIDLDALVDLDSRATTDGVCHWTFLAFPISTLDQYGLPSDIEAQQYIADVQSVGVPIGIWLKSTTKDTGYAAVARDDISQLKETIASLKQYSESFATELSDRLFRDAASSGT